jgi:hypothetical protein
VGGILLEACGNPTPTEDQLATMVAQTLSAQPTETELPEPTRTSTPVPTDPPTATPSPSPTITQTSSPTPLAINLKGEICFPSEVVPPMTIYFEETNTSSLIEMPVAEGQETFEMKLEAGTYIAYAWLPDFSLGGLYSRAVPCGLGNDCDDHTVLPFTITETEISEGIDICDWFAGPFNVPYPPGQDRGEVTGTISGGLSYPSGETPELRVVAFNTDIGYWYWVYSLPGQTFYAINGLLPGTYHVVAYDPDGNAGGHAVVATHALIDVIVEAGKVTEGASINDWDAPPGTFPADPTR